jgi:hypothetical protein
MSREKLKADRELCHACDRVTNWIPSKRGNFLRCEGCGGYFPCGHRCSHLECRMVRGDSLEMLNIRGSH